MKLVTTRQKYKCDFCKKRGIRSAIEKHERRCFRNPDRFCDNCENKGFIVEDYDNIPGALRAEVPCHYCAQRDLEKEKEIDKYYESIAPEKTTNEEKTELPF